MKKQKSKTTASKRRLTKRKLKQKAQIEQQRTNWVEDLLRWVPIDDYHDDYRSRRRLLSEDDGTERSDNDGDGDIEDDDDNDNIEDNHPEDTSKKGTLHQNEVSDNPDELLSTNNEKPSAINNDPNNRDDVKRREVASSSSSIVISIISWNVLADSYCNRSSHKDLPMKFQRRVFDRKQRRHHVQQTLRRIIMTNATTDTTTTDQKQSDDNTSAILAPDLLALQEVDPPLGVLTCLKECGYDGVETTATKGGRVGRVDSCGLYYKPEIWDREDYETVYLDDLATNCNVTDQNNKRENDNNGNNRNGGVITRSKSSMSTSSSKSSPSSSASMSENLRGLQSSLARKNVALLVRLRHKPSGLRIVVVVAHLFWNPAYEYVKLCQAHYVGCRATLFSGDERLPIIFCGDFNSQPKSHVHRYFVEGTVNAKLSAPWYACNLLKYKTNNENQHEQSQSKKDSIAETSHQPGLDEMVIQTKLEKLNLNDSGIDKSNKVTSNGDGGTIPPIRYMVDFTLNRFCRWLRILGIDTAIESEEEEIERTKNGNFVLFDRCIREGRSLLTTSTKLLKRKDCPAGTYLVDVRSNLEDTLVHLLLSHGVQLTPANMLTRCVVCNGSIIEIHDDDQKRQIFKSQQAPDELNDQALDVYECNGCGQGYWWCDKPTSSASRVKGQATKLLELCVAGGCAVSDELGMFEGVVDLDEIRTKGGLSDKPLSPWVLNRLDVVEWLQTENLDNPLKPIQSAYSHPVDGDESVAFTNVTSDFVGHLDWIMYQPDTCRVQELLYIPRSYDELNDFDLPNGHCLPSYDWPSDHLAVGAKLCFDTRHAGESYGNVNDSVEEEKKDCVEVQ